MSKKRVEEADSYLKVHWYMQETPAWKALSAAARAVYLQLGHHYNGRNNGKIAYSVRQAADECNICKETAAKALKELMALGFIEETRHGSFSKKTSIASEWRLTAFYCDLTKSPKTCAFMHREAQARDLHQPRSRASMEPLPCPHCGEAIQAAPREKILLRVMPKDS